MKVLVTGGAGYIGSTTCSALLDAGHTPIILDSLVNGRPEFVCDRIFYQGDIADESLIQRIFREHPDITGTIHFAALIVVPDSVERPYDYYRENVVKSLEFFHILESLNCNRILFSSSASIYDNVPGFVVAEDSPLKPSSPYARTKFMMEMILEDLCRAGSLRGIALRYFNPIGADPKMRSGPYDPAPSHVLGKMMDAALGRLPEFQLTGDCWPTRDGTGLRDYLHVWDLAQAHVKAVECFDEALEQSESQYMTMNLGTGNGVTVKELLSAFEEVYGTSIKTVIAPPRPGDVAGACADATRAHELLGWRAEHTISQAILDTFRWMKDVRPGLLGY